MTGRPRSRAADQAILDAAVRILARDGYQALTMGAVAREAAVGKPTLYRRYPDKAELVGAALVSLTSGPEPVLADDTETDLLTLMRATVGALAAPGAMTILGSLLAQEGRDPSLLAVFAARVFDPRHAVVRGVLARAIDRGELRADAARDIDTFVDLLFGAVLARALRREPPDDDWLLAVVRMVLEGARNDHLG